MPRLRARAPPVFWEGSGTKKPAVPIAMVADDAERPPSPTGRAPSEPMEQGVPRPKGQVGPRLVNEHVRTTGWDCCRAFLGNGSFRDQPTACPSSRRVVWYWACGWWQKYRGRAKKLRRRRQQHGRRASDWRWTLARARLCCASDEKEEEVDKEN
jgi:hypothetical protein